MHDVVRKQALDKIMSDKHTFKNHKSKRHKDMKI